MKHHNIVPYPPPDVHRARASTPPLHKQEVPISTPLKSRPDPEFLIVYLFALRLARKLIASLDFYSTRVEDLHWLDHFLEPYDQLHDLAKITGFAKMSYTASYPSIVARMKTQRKYPSKFMTMNPVTYDHNERMHNPGGITDVERKKIIDFADAAREWGSTVLVPQSEAGRMLELADQRCVADVGRRMSMRDWLPISA